MVQTFTKRKREWELRQEEDFQYPLAPKCIAGCERLSQWKTICEIQ